MQNYLLPPNLNTFLRYRNIRNEFGEDVYFIRGGGGGGLRDFQ